MTETFFSIDEPVTLEELERRFVAHMLKYTDGNATETACLLNMNRRTMYRKHRDLILAVKRAGLGCVLSDSERRICELIRDGKSPYATSYESGSNTYASLRRLAAREIITYVKKDKERGWRLTDMGLHALEKMREEGAQLAANAAPEGSAPL